MVNYNNGKIYKIVCDTTGLMYVGSTTKKYLSQRLDKHRSQFKGWKNGKSHYVTSFKVLENNNFTIVLLELINCNSNDELKGRERFYIQSLVCVNKCIPLRTQQEYYQANKEDIAEYQKEWREANKEDIAEYKKEWYQSNKVELNKNMKEYYQSNKEQILEKQKVKIACECGSTFTTSNKLRHFKTKKHMVFCQPSI